MKHGDYDYNEESDLEHKLKSIDEARDFILDKIDKRPDIGIVCGTGLGGLAETLQNSKSFLFKDIPHFPTSSVPGHAGKLVLGDMSGKKIICMQGRIHAYEGHSMWKVTFAIRVFAALGVKAVILTNASGSVNRSLKEGDVVILKDHINLVGMAGNNPLVGLNDPRFGPRFQEMTTAYDRNLRITALAIAKELSMTYVREGVYCYQFGPAYESPAEIKYLLGIGADVVGMSTVPEVLVARHCGLRCLGISLVTNVCVMEYDTDKKPNHEEVMELGARRSCDLQTFVSKIVALIK